MPLVLSTYMKGYIFTKEYYKSFQLGAASACPIVGYGIERFGRKKCLLLLTAPFLGGWVLITLAQNIWMIYVGRFLSGKLATL